ncbi:hypothetical protein AAE478_007828 [Parahypoxylon ruwenzoriense]
MPRPISLSFNPYSVLGVKPSDDAATIKKAYHALCLRHHPDKSGYPSHERFIEIQEAYELLSDSHWRSEYERVHRAEGGRTAEPTYSQASWSPPEADMFNDIDFEEEYGEDYIEESTSGTEPQSKVLREKGFDGAPPKKARATFRSRSGAERIMDRVSKLLDNLQNAFSALLEWFGEFARESRRQSTHW